MPIEMIFMTINSIDSIKEQLLTDKTYQQNFPKAINFAFPTLYKEIVTHIKTTEISAECILYNSVHAVNETKEFANTAYWEMPLSEQHIKDYWFIGANGQGDLWLLSNDDNVLFFDHNQGEISINKLLDLGLNFEKWLQFVFLNKDFEDGAIAKDDYLQSVSGISDKLSENYPFEV